MADPYKSEDGQQPKLCAICKKSDNLKRCSKCKTVFYCSREHQAAHWPAHRDECLLTCSKDGDQTATNSSRASENHSSEPTYTATGDCKCKHSASPSSPRSPAAGAQPASPRHAHAHVNGRAARRPHSTDTAFDKRPLKIIDFPKPKCLKNLDLLSGHVAIHLKSNGYCVVDGLLTDYQCSSVLSDVRALEQKGRMNTGLLSGGRTSAVKGEKVANKSIRSDKIVWVDGGEEDCSNINEVLISLMDTIAIPLTQYLGGTYKIFGRTKAMVACYPGDGTHYARHVDNPCQDGRVITCIFYLNRDWDTKRQGGVLRLFPRDCPKDYIDVAPFMNRMLFFWSDGRNPHEVQPAYHHRYAITVWYFDHDERQRAKRDQVQQDLSRIRGEIALMDMRKKVLEKSLLQAEIETRAAEAVTSLSEGEFDAISELMQAHPDPRALLTGLGVAPRIQDNLMAKIERDS